MADTVEQKPDQIIESVKRLEERVAFLERQVQSVQNDMAQHKYQNMIYQELGKIKSKLGIW